MRPAIMALAIVVLTGCNQYKKLAKADDAPVAITIKTVAACLEDTGAFPAQVPASHINYVHYVMMQGSYFDGAYHPLQVENCGQGLYDIGDQYYIGWAN